MTFYLPVSLFQFNIVNIFNVWILDNFSEDGGKLKGEKLSIAEDLVMIQIGSVNP